MNASEYQQLAARTLIDAPGFTIPDQEIMLVWNAIGLAGEAGEVAELIKKGVFHRHGVDAEKLKNELGDVLWYTAAMCTKLDVDMSTIMEENIAKLRRRYPDGFSSADSVRRVDVEPAATVTFSGVPADAEPETLEALDALAHTMQRQFSSTGDQAATTPAPAGMEGVQANVDKAFQYMLNAMGIVETLDLDQIGEACVASLAMHIATMQRLQFLLKQQAEKVRR